MTEPVLHNASVVLSEPEKPEHVQALKDYVEAKRPAEELRRKQMHWMKERHGV